MIELVLNKCLCITDTIIDVENMAARLQKLRKEEKRNKEVAGTLFYH